MTNQEVTVREFIKKYKKAKRRSKFKKLTYEDIFAISIETGKKLKKTVSIKYVLNSISLLSIVNDREADYGHWRRSGAKHQTESRT